MHFPIRTTRSTLLPALALLAGVAACRPSGEGKTGATPAAAQSSDAPKTTAVGGEAVASMPADSTALRTAADAGRIAGAPTAKVWMIIASDFQCPYCKMWEDQTYDAVRHDYVDAGKVRMAYMNFPLDQHVQALPAAEAAMCASAQNKFWEYHSALFKSQDTWGKAGDQSAAYDAIATSTGLDLNKFRSCTRSHVMRALIAADRDRMESRGVQSTPSFFVGSQTVAGAQPPAVFRQLLDTALARTR